jgi:hypothetical protein
MDLQSQLTICNHINDFFRQEFNAYHHRTAPSKIDILELSRVAKLGSFYDVLKHIYFKNGVLEFGVASKIISIMNCDMPAVSRKFLEKNGLGMPRTRDQFRITKASNAYEQACLLLNTDFKNIEYYDVFEVINNAAAKFQVNKATILSFIIESNNLKT